jgi:sugar/nucleoside kinase (ribokinase family)
VTDPTVPTGITVVLSRPSDRASLTYAGAISRLSADLVDVDLLRASRHVHVSQFFMQDALRPGLPDLLDEAHAAGASTSIDPNWDPAERWDGDLLAQLGRTDVFLPNAVEAMRIANRPDAETAARELARAAGLVVVKDGADGSLAAERDRLVRAGPLAAEAVDATGAGDAFDAGFLAAHLGGEPLERALVIGNACGALSTRALGGVDGLPTMDEVAALLETDALG